ncbi:uncharacterized protein LOC128741063 [Sabethes cyaneus]|uniref:uncharacterized protein LOC128741063 n=1 Tax=Sabethes cyaneus TaxID=53552 RepID=UPI00237E1844|nr:uncharacterized protein LOC128741063 [Sabethes cyaneus]
MVDTPKGNTVEEQKIIQKKREETKHMEEKFKVLVHQRGAVRAKLTRVRNGLVLGDDEPNKNIGNVHFLRLNLKTVETCYDEFNELQNKIYALPLSDERRAEQEDLYIDFEELHNNLIIRLNELLEVATTGAIKPLLPIVGPTVSAPAQLFLPPLHAPLPTFDGSYEKWYSFKSMFTTIMNRYQQEDPAIKLFHLRNALVGSASGIIDQDIVNSNDYEAAWRFLTDRYEDRRLIMDKHIDALNSLPKVTKENSLSLRRLVDTCTKNVEALKNLSLPIDGLGEQILLNQITSKLDKTTRMAWESRQKKGVYPNYGATIEFLQEQCRIMEKIDINVKPVTESVKVKPMNKGHSLMATNEHKNEHNCIMCKEHHELWKCDQFKLLSLSDKYSALRKWGSCFNCLQKGHRTNGCTSTRNCRDCGKRHHTMLHCDSSSKPAPVESAAAKDNESQTVKNSNKNIETLTPQSVSTLCISAADDLKQIVLSTVVVMVHSDSSALFPCRMLLDSASQMNFVTERLANLLPQRKESVNYLVSGVNGSKTRLRKMIRATVKSRCGEFKAELNFLITPRITGAVPANSFDISDWPVPKGIEWADPAFNKRGRIDMLIGAEIFWDVVKGDRMHLGDNLPVLTKTEFGWIAGGVLAEGFPVIARSLCQVVCEERLEDLLKRFYSLEACDEIHTSTRDSEDCLNHFKETHVRDKDGRYFVRHLFNERKNELGDSRQTATRRFLNLERRLNRQPELKQLYIDFMNDYERLGHMKPIEIDEKEDPGSVFYLPHHGVLKPTNTTTKLRVVFDGSAKSSTGVSINDTLEVGPVVQRDLASILMDFRGFPFVFIVDIPMMFRQIGVLSPDRKYQRILFRKHQNEPVTAWELQTVTYGLATSPFQATMALNQLAEDHRNELPEAAYAIKEGAYMDDILTGAYTLPDACKLQHDVEILLAKGCFGSHKWCSNVVELINNVPEELRGVSFEIAEDNPRAVVKTLGVVWNPIEDWFSFNVAEGDSGAITKRKILSEVAKIFDPLGLIGPVITTAKLILREVSMLQTDWDDPVPQDLLQVWRSFRNELVQLSELRRLTGNFEWHHIPTNENPADFISRGQRPRDLHKNDVWWKGPPMLTTTPIGLSEEPEIPDEDLPEMRFGVSLPIANVTRNRLQIFETVRQLYINETDYDVEGNAYIIRTSASLAVDSAIDSARDISTRDSSFE